MRSPTPARGDAPRDRPPTAFLRPPTEALAQCALTFLEREPIDVALAHTQHAAYAATLRGLGVRVVELASEPELPDSVFVEDPAVVLDEVAVIARPGTPSRRPETDSIARALEPLRPLRFIEPPGTLEGGDMLRIGRTLYVGRSSRTNDEGIAQLRAIAGPLGYDVVAVPVTGCLHLKTGCTAIDDETVLVNPEWIDASKIRAHARVAVPPDEPWGANTLRIEGAVVLPTGQPATRRLLERRGFATAPVEISEFQKAEAGVTCLVLLVR